ncbi:MAG: ATP-binding protein [Erysipelotrichaceae bacterium]
MRKILTNLKKADQDFNLISSNDYICVGISGGKDSMVLLDALTTYQRYSPHPFKLVAIHVNLGFNSNDSLLKPIEDYCNRIAIPFINYKSEIYEILKLHTNDDGTLKCSLCSQLKKACIIEAAKKEGCNCVAFAHHGDDAVETLMMNAINGGRIATFAPKMYLDRSDIKFIRPLVYCSEQQIITAQTNSDNIIPSIASGCPNDGNTQRTAIKTLLNNLYEQYPMAQTNFINMLSNIEQLKLWKKDDE